METNDYVVLFDGLSVPQEDVRLLKPYVRSEQNFFYGEEYRYVDVGNKLTTELNKKQHILREGFSDWCEREFLESDDVSNEPRKTSSVLNKSVLQTHRESVAGSNLVNANGMGNEKGFDKEHIDLTECSRMESDEYTCIIDESALILTDVDYVRAKCKWYFKNVNDFETDHKVIEHMRFLDLFTQLFTVRLINEVSVSQNKEQSTCYNFQGNNIGNTNMEVVCIGHNAFSTALDSLTESTKSNINRDQKRKQEFDPGIFYNNFKDDSDTPKLQHTVDIKSRFKNPYKIEKPCNVYLPTLEMKTEKKNIESVKSLETSMNSNFYAIEDKTCFTKNIKESNLKDKPPARVCEVKNSTLTSIDHLINKKKLRIVKQVGDKLVLKAERSDHNHENSVSKENSKCSNEYKRNCNWVADNGKYENKQALQGKTCRDWTIETIHYRPIASESLMSDVTSVAIDKDVTKNEISKDHNIKIRNTDIGPEGAGDVVTGEEDPLLSPDVIYEFIKSLKAKNDHYNFNLTDDSKESAISSRAASTCVLDAYLEEKNGPSMKKDDAKIIIIGLKYSNPNNQTDMDDTSEYNRLRRYIEGDNLCSPGRYAVDSRMLEELGLQCRKPSENVSDNQDCFNTFKYRSQTGSSGNLHRPLAPESDVESEISSTMVINRSFTNTSGHCSPPSSTSSDDLMKNKRKKHKRPGCKKCRKDVTVAIPNIKIPDLNKKTSQNIYVSCWKRFCVIL